MFVFEGGGPPRAVTLASNITSPGSFGPWRISPKDLARHIKAKSAINLPLFEELSRGFDPRQRSLVIDGLLYGFRLGVVVPPVGRSWVPSFLSDVARNRIGENFARERDLGRMLGPFSSPPSGQFWRNAVAIPVSEAIKGDGKFRTIFNFSYDWENSTNAGIPESYGFTTYPTFEEVGAAILRVGLDKIYFALFDVQTAFRNLRIHPDDWPFQVVAWQEYEGGPRCWWIDLALPFGVRVGPAIFNFFGDVLEYVLKRCCFDDEARRLYAQLKRYLDDHLLMINGLALANTILDRMLGVMKDLNIPVKESKTVRPSEVIKYTGFLWDPRKDLVTLDLERWSALHTTLIDMDGRLDLGAVNAHEVRSLAGLLCWASKVILFGMLHTRGLYGVLSDLGVISARGYVARRLFISDVGLIHRIRYDILWWLELYQLFLTEKWTRVGRRISNIGVVLTPVQSRSSLVLYSDMSGDGLGGYWYGTGLWAFAPIPDHITLSHFDKTRTFISSGHGECAGILMVLLTFLPIWAEQRKDRPPEEHITVFTDSSSAVGAWNGEKAKEGMLPYLHAFERLCAAYNIYMQLIFVPGVQNKIADQISRQEGLMTPELRLLFPDGDPLAQPRISQERLFW